MKPFTYLLIDIFTILIPFIFSFHPKLRFYKKWKEAFASIFIVAIFFIIWDVFYTEIGVWGFNADYLIDLNIINLPIEEILFFICIPYACLFTYFSLKKMIKPLHYNDLKWATIFISTLLALTGIIFIDKLYTSLTFILYATLILLIQYNFTRIKLPRIYFSLLILIIPFLIVNGILTGSGIDEPIVWYNSKEIIGTRILTIPAEDFIYGSLLITLNIFLFERFSNNKTTT